MKTTISVEQRHIDDARHSEVDNGRQVGTDPISRAVLEVLKAEGIKHDRAWVYRKPGRPDLWLCVRQNEDVKLPAECSYFMTKFDERIDGAPAPFCFQVNL
jgi:hypothetical protein